MEYKLGIPTIREICKLANIKSTAAVHAHIKKLKAEGHITTGVDMPRSIALTKKRVLKLL